MQFAKLARLLLQKAEQDRYAMNRLLEDPSAPDEVVGFHAQQAVEKLTKAVLAHHSVEYQWTHQLERLVTLLRNAGISYPPELSEAVVLTPYAVELRYDMLPIHDDATRPSTANGPNAALNTLLNGPRLLLRAAKDDAMRVTYFPDTDTLLLQFNDRGMAETYDVNEDILVEVDKDRRVVSMTIEHATRQTNVNEFSYQVGSV